MRIATVVLALALVIGGPQETTADQWPAKPVPDGFVPAKTETITILDEMAVGLTESTYIVNGRPVDYCYGSLEIADARYTYHGEPPTAEDGHPLKVGQDVEAVGIESIRHWRFISTSAVHGKIFVTCGWLEGRDDDDR